MSTKRRKQSGSLHDDVAGRTEDLRAMQCCEGSVTEFRSVVYRARYIDGSWVQRRAERTNERERNGASEGFCEGKVCGWV